MPFSAEIGSTPGGSVHFSRRAAAALAAAFIFLAIAAAAAVYMALRAVEAQGGVGHTIEVRRQAQELKTSVAGAQSSIRGFLLSEDPAFIEPYDAALTEVPETLERLRSLTADNPSQNAAAEGLAAVVQQFFGVYDRMRALADDGRRDDAIGLVRDRVGQDLMDDIGARVDRFAAEELRLLNERQATVARLLRWTVALVLCALLTATILATLFARSTLHYVNRLTLQSAELEKETQRRLESEATLVQAQKMDAIGQLTGGIAHDFNNMLTIIIGSLATVQRRLKENEKLGEAAAGIAKPVDSAMKGARGAAQLTHRLLAFSRRQTLVPSQVDLNRIVSGMTELLRRTIGENVQLEVVLAAGLWPTFVDAAQLENALVNLAVNARDAMPEGGRVTIETANVQLDEAYAARFGDIVAGQYALLSVTDDGLGIPAAHMPRVFEPFFTTKREGEGSGLGLAMVHGFVKQSGGHARIYSEEGRGTTVKLYLPRLAQATQVDAAPAERPPAADAADRDLTPGTVMVVEDNEGVREYARGALEEGGFRVIEASNAAEALAHFENGCEVDLLFTDVVLGSGPSGRELADEVLRKRPGLPVLFTTGYSRNAIFHNDRLDPGVELLGKPYTQHELARKIRDLLDRQAAREPRTA